MQKRSIKMILTSLLLATLATAVACQTPPEIPDESTGLPDTIETVMETEPVSEADTVIDIPEPEPSISAVKFPEAALPDYAQYATPQRISEKLTGQQSIAIAIGGKKYYNNGELSLGGINLITKNDDGSLSLKPEKMGPFFGRNDLTGTSPEAIAQEVGMSVVVYDQKLILFYDGKQPLNTYEDMYTYEAMYLYMTDAGEEEIINAFMDLPSRISNNINNTIYYTAPDLNLGIQTSMYFNQMGQMNSLSSAPALVAGEGKHADNFTTVRVFNNQNVCVTQFLAFDASVKGGVQVAAAQVGEQVFIATAPFADHDGTGGDVRVFDTFGLIRMTVSVRDVIPGPYTIMTGHFAETTEDEVLLVASQTTNDQGELKYALISLADGSVISKHTLDCSFALTDEKAGVPVQMSVRAKDAAVDSVILYFNSVQAVYEGNAQAATFENSGIILPEDAISVSASTLEGQKYVVSLPIREGQENQSFMMIYGENDVNGTLQDVGFKENRFYYLSQDKEMNDDKYVSASRSDHIRTDLGNQIMSQLGKIKSDKEIEQLFDNALYADYAHSSATQYINKLYQGYMYLEPCFTHRWNVTSGTKALANYVETESGTHKYIVLGKNGDDDLYWEGTNSYYMGTYADGILDLAKLRLYPLRSFLQQSAVAYRGVDAIPEHLVTMSPAHEHEIAAPNSVGDYNLYMIEGFRSYLLDRYGSVENINEKFNSHFANRSEIDAPRGNGRGDWDVDRYGEPYFEEWVMYNRSIVSKRIMEAYREALLAGYAPETISAHQIPEGEAVGGDRLTPTDVVLTCGTAYGGTRYGTVALNNNLVYNANKLGHWNITLGEYSSTNTNSAVAYKQLKSHWNHGLRAVLFICFNDEQYNAEYSALNQLIEENQPRPGYTGGTYGAVGVRNGDKKYNIVQIGAGAESDKSGLLKSLDAEGKWEGTVYVVPFHTKVTSKALTALNAPVEGTQNTFATGSLGRIKNADQAEITFVAAKKGDARAWVTFEVWCNGYLMNESITTYELSTDMTPYRYVLSNQIYDENLEIKVTFHTEAGDGSMDSIVLENMYGTLQTENAGFVYYDGNQVNRISKAHQGGVTFDLLDRELRQ